MANISPASPKWKRNAKGIFVPKPGAKVERTCPVCDKQFETYRRLSATNTCSRTCAYELIRGNSQAFETRACRHCQSSFQFQKVRARLYVGAGKFCSALCRNEAKVKQHDARGVKPRYKHEAHLKADKIWKKAVREKDEFTCQRCGKYDPHIHAHHVAPRGRRPDLIREVSNGKCLCASCHAWVHMHPIEATEAGLLSDETYEKARKVRLSLS